MKFLKIFILVVVLLVVTTFLFIQINSRDLPTVNDADLIPEPVTLLLEEDNAYFTLLIGYENAEANDRVLTDAFIAAAEKTGYQCPDTVNNYSMHQEGCPLTHVRDMALLTLMRASTSLAVGDVSDAVSSSLAVIKVADSLAENGSLIQQLVSMALYGLAADSLQSLVEFESLSEQERQKVFRTLDLYSPNEETLMRAYKTEYVGFKEIISDITLGKPLPGQFEVGKQSAYSWHPNRTTNEFAQLYRLIINGDPDGRGVKWVQKLMTPDPVSTYRPNAVGIILLTVVAGSMNDATGYMSEIEASYETLQLAFE